MSNHRVILAAVSQFVRGKLICFAIPFAFVSSAAAQFPSIDSPELLTTPEPKVVQGEDGLAIVLDAPPATCDGSCGATCDVCNCCITGGWYHCVDIWADFIYLRPRDAEIAVAVNNGVPAQLNPVQFSRVSMLDVGYQPSFRAGFDYVLSECSKVGAAYTFFDGQTNAALQATPPTQVASLVSHRGVLNAQGPHQQVNATYSNQFQLVDVDYRKLLFYNCDHQLGYLVGVRGVHHEQHMAAMFTGTVSRTVRTDVDFYGLGLRTGIEWERYIACQWNTYAKAYGALLPGEFDTKFNQNQAQGGPEVTTGWKAGRIVTTWDLELGAGWTSKCGRVHASLGYVFSAWTNMVQTDEWIRAVRQNNFIDMSSTSTYDGVVGRAEVRF